MEISINDFVQDNKLEKITLPPMNKMHRSIVYVLINMIHAYLNVDYVCSSIYSHEIAEIAGLSAFSFGEEDIDRHVVIYKKEFTPSPEELTAYRKGQAWNPALVKLVNNHVIIRYIFLIFFLFIFIYFLLSLIQHLKMLTI